MSDDKKARMRTAADVVKRLRWDPDLPVDDFTMGYLDRFRGVLEKRLASVPWDDVRSPVLLQSRHMRI